MADPVQGVVEARFDDPEVDVELALVEWIEKADKRLRRDNREAAEALRQLADELAGD